MTPADRDHAMLCLLAIDRGRLVPDDAGGLPAVFADMPPLPVPRWVFDWCERTGLIRIVGDDRAELTGRGRGQVNAWARSRGAAFLRRLRKKARGG